MVSVLFVVGLGFLILGAEMLVRGASRLAGSIGISPLIIGLTVVAFGTSAPEFAVSLKSAFAGQASIAVGNVVGSNIFNVLFILGIAALICPLVVSNQLIRLDVPLMIAASVLVFLLAGDGLLSRVDGVVLFSGLVVYTAFLFYSSGRVEAQESAIPSETLKVESRVKSILLVVGGLVMLVIGSRWLVNGAVALAQYLGVGELIIGLTIIAAGTSLPEVVTSVVASLRGQRDIAVGNVVGSNLFNLLGVLGLSATVAPAAIEVPASVLTLDLPIMTAVAFVCLPVFFSGGVISRWEGGFLFGYYLAYTTYLVLRATQHEAFPAFHAAMVYFVVPLTLVTLVVVTVQSVGRKRNTESN